MPSAPIILVPGFWLGAWAWDDLLPLLVDSGRDARALTLPGLESVETDRSAITTEDHVTAIVSAIEAAPSPVVLALHSGAGASGYGAIDRVPGLVAHAVYVDTGPAIGALGEDFAGSELPLPSIDQLAQEENLDGLTDAQLARFAQRAVPQPGGVLREATVLENEERLDVPSTVVCTGFRPDTYREAVAAGHGFVAGLAELRDVRWIDLPTSHWPMWSRPGELAEIIGRIALRPE